MPTERRITWEEMVATYPDQWIGVAYPEMDGADIVSGIVKFVGKDVGELTLMQMHDDNLISVYTTSDNLAPLGVVGYFG